MAEPNVNVVSRKVARVIASFEANNNVEEVGVYGNGTLSVIYSDDGNANSILQDALEVGMIVKAVNFDRRKIRLVFDN